jgi:hypothetical protein
MGKKPAATKPTSTPEPELQANVSEPESPASDPKKLAQKFAQTKKDQAERQTERGKREAVRKGKTALERVVIPYLRRVKEQFYEIAALPEDFLFDVSKLDREDNKPLGVYFRVGGGPTIVISINSNGVTSERLGETGGRTSPYPANKPIKSYADLTEENLGRLIGLMIDESSG